MSSASLEEEYTRQRTELVGRLRGSGSIIDEATAQAMLAVPRERFVPTYLAHRAYDDEPLSIGLEQTISAPHMVAIMTDALQASAGMRVLEIGSGSGYQAAVLSRIVGPTGRIITIERIRQLSERAALALRQAGAANVDVKTGDGSMGYPIGAPYDRILVTASAPEIPPPLLDQLAEDGVLVIPVGGRECTLVRVRKRASTYAREPLGACAFVPLLGAHGQDPRAFGR